MKAAETPYIEEAFRAPNAYQHFCPNCDGINACSDTQNTAKPYNKNFQGPAIIPEPSYITELAPAFTQREMNYGGATTRDLGALLQEKAKNPTMLRCNHANKTTNDLQKHWRGFAYSPEVLTLDFDRSSSKKYKLTLPLEMDFEAYVRAPCEKTRYRLVTEIKKLPVSGDYASFVHTEDGKWWRCMDNVKEVPIGQWQGDVKHGETVMAMYERLDT
jgi:hypothetical protein